MKHLALATILSALAVTACSPVEYYKVALNGASEVPPTRTAAMGAATVSLNPNTSLVTWNVQYGGLSGPATGAHFHGPAAPGANAPVVVPFTNADKTPITGSASLTPAQVDALRSGQWYMNIHTAANPGGEIRGQVTR